MPDEYGNPTEAELRGQSASDRLLTAYMRPTRADLDARDAAARAGDGTITLTIGGQPVTLTGSQLRASTDPQVVAVRNQMIASGRSDPNLLFGPLTGRQPSELERRYRAQYRSFMNNPNDGVSGSDAALGLGAFALAALGGGYLAGLGAPGAAAGAAGAGLSGSSLGTAFGTSLVGEAAATAAGSVLPGAAAATAATAAGYGANGGFNPTSDPAGVFSRGIGSGSNAGDLVLSGGAGNGLPEWASQAGNLLGGDMKWTDWIGPLIDAGTSIWGANEAGDAVRDGSREAIAENRRQFDLVRGDTAPVRALGNAAVDRLARLYGYGMPLTPGGAPTAGGPPDMTAFFESPDYRFNLAEGQKAIDRSAAARGGLLSGSAVREGTRYASNLATREYAGFVDRLMQQAGLGSTGIGQSAAAGANSAGNISSAAINSGNARASIYGNLATNINNAAQSGINAYMLRRYLEG